jgi:hypothetical protein
MATGATWGKEEVEQLPAPTCHQRGHMGDLAWHRQATHARPDKEVPDRIGVSISGGDLYVQFVALARVSGGQGSHG